MAAPSLAPDQDGEPAGALFCFDDDSTAGLVELPTSFAHPADAAAAAAAAKSHDSVSSSYYASDTNWCFPQPTPPYDPDPAPYQASVTHQRQLGPHHLQQRDHPPPPPHPHHGHQHYHSSSSNGHYPHPHHHQHHHPIPPPRHHHHHGHESPAVYPTASWEINQSLVAAPQLLDLAPPRHRSDSRSLTPVAPGPSFVRSSSAATATSTSTAAATPSPPASVTPLAHSSNPALAAAGSASLLSTSSSPTEAPPPRVASFNFVGPSPEGLGVFPPSDSCFSHPDQARDNSVSTVPMHYQYLSPKSEPSPASSTGDSGIRLDGSGCYGGGTASSPESGGAHHLPATAPTNGSGGDAPRKRKAAGSDPDDDDDEEDDSGQPVKKTAHNMIEKRYRNNLNDKIAALRDSVPSLRIMSKSARGEDTTEDREELHGLTPAHKLNKATILSKATEYIRHLEKRNSLLMDENGAMQARISAFEKLVMGGAMPGVMTAGQLPPAPLPSYPADDIAYMNTPLETASRGSAPPGGIIPQQMSAQQQQQQFGMPQRASFNPDQHAMMRRQQQQRRRQQQQQQQQHQQQRQSPTSESQSQSQQHQQQQLQKQQIQLQKQQEEAPAARSWVNAAPYFGKLMVGSFAGLMMLEAIRETEPSAETTDGRGLFALPVRLLGLVRSSLHIHIMGHHIPAHVVIHYLKVLFFAGIFLWAWVPSLFAPPLPPPGNRLKAVAAASAAVLDGGHGDASAAACGSAAAATAAAAAAAAAAATLASSIDLRRQAWLTAIQTVWVPKHNYVLELAALGLKTIKLSLRNAIGVDRYQMLTGLTEEQETARVKAWSIALDAQLAGGDVEINESRLTLTLLASMTLPTTPLRLMLQALHLRVLLWDLGQLGGSPVHVVAAKLARSRWNEARERNRMIVRARRAPASQSADRAPAPASSGGEEDEPLPNYLAALVERECDEVLNSNIVQRAHNLAWNRATTHGTETPIDGMDAVVEDRAIRSPLDAVAAWWCCQTVHDALVTSVTMAPGKDTDGACCASAASTTSAASAAPVAPITPAASAASAAELAVLSAPVASAVRTRALVACAVLASKNYSSHIVPALRSLEADRMYMSPAGPLHETDPSRAASAAGSASAAQANRDLHNALRGPMILAHFNSIKAGKPLPAGLRIVRDMYIFGPSPVSLVGAVSAIHVMEKLFSHDAVRETVIGELERLAGGLRLWFGFAPAERVGLTAGTRRLLVERCLAVTREAVGIDNDTGYGSGSEGEQLRPHRQPMVVVESCH